MALCYKCNKNIPFRQLFLSGFTNGFKYLFSSDARPKITCPYCLTINQLSKKSQRVSVLLFFFIALILVLINKFSPIIISGALFFLAGLFPKIPFMVFNFFILVIIVIICNYFLWKYFYKFEEFRKFLR